MKIFQNAGDDFSKENPGIEVAVESIGQDIWHKVFASVPAGTGPTLCKMITTSYFKLRDQGLVLELPEDVFPREWIRDTFPTFMLDAYGAYVLPEGNQPAVFVYNKAMFEEAGFDPDVPPSTWEEFFSCAQKLTTYDASGAIVREGFAYDDWLPTLNPLYQLGGTVVKREDGRLVATFDTPEMEQAHQFFHDLAFKYKAWDRNFPYFTEAIGNGLAATSICEAWAYGEWRANYPDVFEKLAVAAPPTPTGEPRPYYGRYNTVLGLAMLANRPHQETLAGLKFMEYLYKKRTDIQFALAEISGLVPIHVELLASPQVAEHPLMSLGSKLVPKEYDAVDIPDPFAELVGKVLDMVIIGGEPIKAALQYGQAGLQKLIDAGDVKYLR
jgi:ABC-type glycerol-3-phosphate transport system substrate-binding protein